MSYIRCFHCKQIKNGDEEEFETSPVNDCEMICPDCFEQYEENMEKTHVNN